MRIFLTLNPSKDVYSQIELAKKLGFDGVEIVLEDDMREVVEKEKEKIKNKLENLGIYACFHLPNWLNILNRDDLKEIFHLYKIVEYFNSFGVLHIFSDDEKSIKKYKIIEKEIKDKNLYFENLFQRTEILENIFVFNLKFVIDISHFLTANPFPKFKEFLLKNKNKIFHFHFSDNNGITHSHLPLGKGILPIKKIIEILVEYFNDRSISFEIFETDIPELDFEISIKIFKNIIDKYGKK